MDCSIAKAAAWCLALVLAAGCATTPPHKKHTAHKSRPHGLDDYTLTEGEHLGDGDAYLQRAPEPSAEDADAQPAEDLWLAHRDLWEADASVRSHGQKKVMRRFIVARPDAWALEEPKDAASAVRPLIQGDTVAGIVDGAWVAIGVSEYVPRTVLVPADVPRPGDTAKNDVGSDLQL